MQYGVATSSIAAVLLDGVGYYTDMSYYKSIVFIETIREES